MTRPRLRMLFTDLDRGVYRGHSQRPGGLAPLNKRLNKSPLNLKIKKLSTSLVLLLLLQMVIPMPAVAASYSKDELRVYAHSRIINYKEFKCFDSIILKESSYNYLARNGSHYGIGQMRSTYYQSRDPYTQIDLTIAYCLKRYSSICNAWSFHKKHGYY
jgi:hypothetical protein